MLENRNGLLREEMATKADGQAGTDAALLMAARLAQTGKRHEGYRLSFSNLSKRWLGEKAFGWMKQTGGLKKAKLRGLDKVEGMATYAAAAYNLLRPKTLQRLCAERRERERKALHGEALVH